jgi:hypothetical protein
MQEISDNSPKNPRKFWLSSPSGYNRPVIFKVFQNGSSLRENRPVFIGREIGSNARTWFDDVNGTYIQQGIREKDPIKIGVGIPMAVASTFTELGDYLMAGAADQRLEPPSGLMGRTRRDIAAIAQNNIRHPIRTVLSGVRLISDVPMDGVDVFADYRHGSRASLIETLNHPHHN